MYRYPVDLVASTASMMAAVDQTGSAAVNRSRTWNVFARLFPLSELSAAVMFP
jgi:hypothetical protein